MKKKKDISAKTIRELTQELVEVQARTRREIAFWEKEPSLSRREATNLRFMRLMVALSDKIIAAAPQVIETARREEAEKRPKRKGRSRRATP